MYRALLLKLSNYRMGGNVQVNDVIAALVKRSGKSYNAVSADLGRSREYVRQAATSKRGPALATVADVADAAGCDVVIVDRETGATVATVTPPRRAAE